MKARWLTDRIEVGLVWKALQFSAEHFITFLSPLMVTYVISGLFRGGWTGKYLWRFICDDALYASIATTVLTVFAYLFARFAAHRMKMKKNNDSVNVAISRVLFFSLVASFVVMLLALFNTLKNSEEITAFTAEKCVYVELITVALCTFLSCLQQREQWEKRKIGTA